MHDLICRTGIVLLLSVSMLGAATPTVTRVASLERAVADNPGDWAFHCHVIEHQKTGLAGFVRIG